MKQFKEFKIDLINEKDEEMGVKNLITGARVSIDLLEIESFREQTTDEGNELSMLTVEQKEVLIDALELNNLYIEFMAEYRPADSTLAAIYTSSLDSFVHIRIVKKQQPYRYVENGLIHEEEMVSRVREKKPIPATQQGYNQWLIRMKLKYLK